jgi:uncharacterized membrane protein
MKLRRAELFGLVMVILSFATVAAFYERLPERIATHWNARGVADGFMPKAVGSLAGPLMTTGVYVLFLVLPRISPKAFSAGAPQSPSSSGSPSPW